MKRYSFIGIIPDILIIIGTVIFASQIFEYLFSTSLFHKGSVLLGSIGVLLIITGILLRKYIPFK